MKKSSGLTPRAPDTSNQSESALKKTLQKLLKTRSSKVNRKLEKDLRRSSSQWQSYTQKPVQSAYPAPDEPVLENDLPPVRQPRLSADTEEVASTLDAMGWEQATVGGSVTAEYWQFVPHGDTMDMASLASQHGKDGCQTPLSGLQTPPSAFERRRNSMHQLACAISQPSLAESTSPVSSFYLQRQTSTLPPHPDAIPRNTTEQQRTTSRTQQRAFLTPLELDVMPRSSSDWQQYPVTSGWQHQHQQYTTSVHSHQQRSMTSSHQRLCQSNPGPMLGPTLTTQQQQQHPAAKPMANQEARALGTAATTLVQQTGLFSEPPSASWGREWPAGSPSDHQMALNFSSLAISNFRDPSGDGGQTTVKAAQPIPMQASAPFTHAVSSPLSLTSRTQSGQQASYGGRPPLGRAPATPPQAWDPWYPLARQRLPFSAAPCADTSSPSLTTRQTSSTRPPPAPASQAEPVPHANLCTSVIDRLSSAPGDNGSRGSKSQGGRLTGSQGQSTRSSLPAPSPPAAWLHSQSAQQLTANVKQLAAQVVSARSRQAQELAILKLYAVLSQAHFVKQQAEEWEGAFLGILALGFPLLLKHTAEIVVHSDKGYSNMVRGMAAATLKSIACWMEGQLEGASPCRALVQQVLTQLVQEASQMGSRCAGAQGPTIRENEAWDSMLPTQQSIGLSEVSGMGELLDSGTLDGMLDTDATSAGQPGRGDQCHPRWGTMETAGAVGSSSVMDSEVWQEALQQRHPPPALTVRPPSILESGATCMALDTQDMADYARSHARGLRLTFWLFKTDQEDAWYAAASLVGSIASMGEAHIDGMGGMKLVKPLFLVMRRGGNDCRAAALRALQHLTTDRACRAMTARQDSYLQALVRAVHHTHTSQHYPATIVLARLISNDPSTHYIVAEAGLIPGLAKLVKQGDLPAQVRDALSEALKHLTASSQKNRNTLVSLQVLPLIIAQLQTGEEGVQYNTARTLRHLALGSQPAHKKAALPAVVPLTQALQLGKPKVQFACASALAMLVEGQPETCPQVLRHGGVAALTIMLQTAGAQGRKAAAEALQALAAEDMDMKPRIAKSGAIPPLVGMLKSGNVQQQAAAAGALQALMYCPPGLDIAAGVASEGGIAPLLHMLGTGPLPLRSAAAAALCNLALASPHNQAAIIKGGALPALTVLLERAQPDGQYAAAAALYNLAGQDSEVRLTLVTLGAVPPLVQMLRAESWYCRIVAAEVLGRVSMEWGSRAAIEQAGAVDPLINLLRLNHSPGMLDSVEGPVHHLSYERGEDVIVMKGYKFAKAKTAAAATLGCLALANPTVAAYLVHAGVAEQLVVMLESNNPEVRAVACACLGDLAASHPPLQPYLTQRLSKLVRLIAGSKGGEASHGSRPDAAAAAAAVGLLVSQQPPARGALMQLRGLKPLLAMLHQGTLAEQSVAANVLFDMSQGCEEAGRVVQEQGVVERVHVLLASTDTPAAAAGGGTAALLRTTSLLAYSGFAMTAKPSVNLLLLLQIPFDEVTGGRGAGQPHTLVPANLLLTTVQSLAPSTSQPPQSTQKQGTYSPHFSSGGDTDQEDDLDAALGPLQPVHSQSNLTSGPAALHSRLPPAWAPEGAANQAVQQEQYAQPTISQYQQRVVQQQILDTYLG